MDAAKSLVTLPPERPRTLEQRIQDQVAEYNKLHAVGLTAVRHPGDSVENYRMRKEMERRGVLTMRVTQLLRLAGTSAAIEQTLKSSGLSPDDGDALLRLGGMKLVVDGGFEGGFMRQPYEEPYGEDGKYRGLQTMPPDRFNEMVSCTTVSAGACSRTRSATQQSTKCSPGMRPPTQTHRSPANVGESSTRSSAARIISRA